MKNLFFNYYQSPDRQHEIDKCLEMNKLVFDRVILVEGRPTFAELFSLTKDYPNDINCFCNSDVYFESTDLLDKLGDKDCFAITRDDLAKDNRYNFQSQDAWCFRGEVKGVDANFTMGMWGCLHGDTIINYVHGKRCGNRPMKLSKLYDKFTKDGWTDIKTYSLRDDGILFYNNIVNIIKSGVKNTIKITFNDNSFLVLTKDHRICVDVGIYKESIKLNIGDWVVAKGSMKNIVKKQIVKIEEYGEFDTYDIQMESPSNNFSANGIIVHNCDNRIAAEITNVGYNLFNPCHQINLVHLHAVDKRNYQRTAENTVYPPYQVVYPTTI